MKIYRFLFLLVPMMLLIACSDSSDKKQDLWAGTQSVELTGERVKLKIPTAFKRSSRYRIKEDLPEISNDSFRLTLLQNMLANLEFEDSEIDLFVDTTQMFRIFWIINTELIAFNQAAGNIFNVKLKQEYEALERNSIGLKAEKIDSRMKSNNRQKVLKYKYRLLDTITDQEIFQSIFFVSTKIQSFIIYEISSEKNDIEKYLWSIKD